MNSTATKKCSLTEGNIACGIIVFLIPIIVGSLIQQLYITVDAAIVGQFTGRTGLAAIDSVHTLFKFPLNFMNGLSAGATIIISGHYGAGDGARVNGAVRAAVLLSIVLGLVCSIAGFLMTPFMIEIMAVPDEISEMTFVYTRIYFSGIWSMILYNMTAGILRAFGDSKKPLYVLMLCSLINILGDLLLVGALRMGVKGAAISTVFAQVMSAIIILYYLFDNKLKGIVKGNYFKNIVAVGFPLALQSMLFPIANSIVQASVNTMGTDSIAAWGICDKLSMLIWLIADSMAPAITTYVSQNIGAGKRERVNKGSIIGCGIAVISVGVVSLILFAGSGILGKWFIPEREIEILIPLVTKYMRMMAPFYIFYAIGEVFSGVCCGMGKTLISMLTTMCSICLLRVICIWIIFPYFHSMECIIWIYIASWIAVGMSFLFLYCQVAGYDV